MVQKDTRHMLANVGAAWLLMNGINTIARDYSKGGGQQKRCKCPFGDAHTMSGVLAASSVYGAVGLMQRLPYAALIGFGASVGALINSRVCGGTKPCWPQDLAAAAVGGICAYLFYD